MSDPRGWELAPLRETFVALFGPAHAAALRQLGAMAHGMALELLPFPQGEEPFEVAELRAVATDARYLERYLLETVAASGGAHGRLARRWASRLGRLAQEIEERIQDEAQPQEVLP